MAVETRTLGRTGLQVTLLGLGGGGNSRLGFSTGQDEAHAADVVRAALDLGLNLIDTARGYGTERAVGLALRDRRRDRVMVSSKSHYLDEYKELLSPQAFEANLETSLRELGLEAIDIYFIHGLRLPYYNRCRELFLPVLDRARRAGKIRWIGVTEAFETDTRHEMLQQAVQDADWDVIMVGFNLLNQSARERVLAYATEKEIGTLGMFAVRRALVDEGRLRSLLRHLVDTGEISPELAVAPDLMEALGLRGMCESLPEAAYRFCAYEPGINCVLSGTSSPEHLRFNIEAVERGPLPQSVLDHLQKLFGRVDSISGQVR
jgi:L-galactose dehydrogenase